MMDSKQYSSFLKDSIHDKDEIRVWVGFGLTVPRCLILRFVQQERHATHLTLKTARGRPSVGEKVEWVVSKTPLGIPKSGWDEFEKFLKSLTPDRSICQRVSREGQSVLSEPGADRGPRAGSPRGVVGATGFNNSAET